MKITPFTGLLWMVLILGVACGDSSGYGKTPSGQLVNKRVADSNTRPAWLTKAYLLGHFDPAVNPLFVEVSGDLAEHKGMYLRKETLAALRLMSAEASAAGLPMKLRSATRNFDRQKEIWEAKWRGDRLLEGRKRAPMAYPDPYDRAKAILLWSSMPGSSRHHWGTDVDLNAFDNSYFKKGIGLKWYTWMQENAAKYGFCQPYTAKDASRPSGYNEERWHWSYYPLSSVCLSAYVDSVSYPDFSGFLGYEMADSVRIIDDYVMGVHSRCK